MHCELVHAAGSSVNTGTHCDPFKTAGQNANILKSCHAVGLYQVRQTGRRFVGLPGLPGTYQLSTGMNHLGADGGHGVV